MGKLAHIKAEDISRDQVAKSIINAVNAMGMNELIQHAAECLAMMYDDFCDEDSLEDFVNEWLNKESQEEWKPDSPWDDHPDWPREDWMAEAGCNDTALGYVDWVNAQIDWHNGGTTCL